jgi:diguanylate cyclase
VTEDQILDTLPNGLVVLDRGYHVRRWNHWMMIHSGLSREKVLDNSVFNFYPDLNKPTFLRACKAVFAFGNVVYLSQKLHKYLFPFPHEQNREDPEINFMQQSCIMSPVRNGDGKIAHVAITVHDVTDNVILEKRLRLMSNLDELTGAYNRRFLDRRLREEFDRHQRYSRPLCLCMFDLDKFKEINDNIGHLAGDYVLVQIGKLADEQLRGIDILVRYGGEEFVCVLPETGLGEGCAVAERLRKTIEAYDFSWRDKHFTVTASFGLSELHPETASPQELIETADKALYEAKVERNRVVVAS